jgi:hypothetical protein
MQASHRRSTSSFPAPAPSAFSCPANWPSPTVRSWSSNANADPHSPFKQLPFGIRGLSAPTIEALYRRGLLDELEVPRRLKNPFGSGSAQAAQAPRQAGHFAGIGFQADRIDSRALAMAPCRDRPTPSLIAEMAELEAVLARRAQALGVEIRRGLRVERFRAGRGRRRRAAGGSWPSAAMAGRLRRRPQQRAQGGRLRLRRHRAGVHRLLAQLSTLPIPEKLGPGRQLTPGGMSSSPSRVPGHPGIRRRRGPRCGTAAHARAPAEVLRRVSGTDVAHHGPCTAPAPGPTARARPRATARAACCWPATPPTSTRRWAARA